MKRPSKEPCMSIDLSLLHGALLGDVTVLYGALWDRVSYLLVIYLVEQRCQPLCPCLYPQMMTMGGPVVHSRWRWWSQVRMLTSHLGPCKFKAKPEKVNERPCHMGRAKMHLFTFYKVNIPSQPQNCLALYPRTAFIKDLGILMCVCDEYWWK